MEILFLLEYIVAISTFLLFASFFVFSAVLPAKSRQVGAILAVQFEQRANEEESLTKYALDFMWVVNVSHMCVVRMNCCIKHGSTYVT